MQQDRTTGVTFKSVYQLHLFLIFPFLCYLDWCLCHISSFSPPAGRCIRFTRLLPLFKLQAGVFSEGNILLPPAIRNCTRKLSYSDTIPGLTHFTRSKIDLHSLISAISISYQNDHVCNHVTKAITKSLTGLSLQSFLLQQRKAVVAGYGDISSCYKNVPH